MSVTGVGFSAGKRVLLVILRLLFGRVVAFFSWRVLRPRLEPMLEVADRWHHQRSRLGGGWRSLGEDIDFDLDFADEFLPEKKVSGAGSVITLRRREGATRELSNAVVTVEVLGPGEYGDRFRMCSKALVEDVPTFEEVEANGCLREALAIDPQTFLCEDGYVYSRYNEVVITLKSLNVDGRPKMHGDRVRLHLTLADHFAHDDGWTVQLWGRHWSTKLFQVTQSQLRGTIKTSLLTAGEQHGMIRLGIWGRMRKSVFALLTLPRVLVWLFWACLTLHLIIPDAEGDILDDEGNVNSRIRGLSIRSIRRCLGVPERDPYEG